MENISEWMPLLVNGLIAFVTAFWAGAKIAKNNWLALLAGMVYLLIPHRLYSLKVVWDEQESLTWAIMPVFVYAVYLLWVKCFAVLSKNVVLKSLVGLSLGIAVLTMMNRQLWIRDILLYLGGEFTTDGYSLQNSGLYPVQYFMVFPSVGDNTNLLVDGMVNSAPVGIGPGLLLGVLLYIWLLVMGRTKGGMADLRKKEVGFANIMLVTGLIAAFFSTNVCPWDDLRFSGKAYGIAVILIQNPARLTGIAAGCFFAVTCVALMLCADWRQETKR